MSQLDGSYADWILEKWKNDNSSTSFEKMFRLLDDLEAAPLIPIEDVARHVERGHYVTIAATHNYTLSPAMLNTIKMLAEGLSYKQIAEKLGINKSTVAQHAVRARVRLRVRTNEAAVATAIGMGLFEPPQRLATEGRFMSMFPARPAPLEARVLERIAKGDTNAEIAKWLDVSSEYVKDIVEQLLQLYGARNRTHLVALAIATDTLRFVSSRHKEES